MSNIPFTRRTLQREIRMLISFLEILFTRDLDWLQRVSKPTDTPKILIFSELVLFFTFDLFRYPTAAAQQGFSIIFFFSN